MNKILISFFLLFQFCLISQEKPFFQFQSSDQIEMLLMPKGEILILEKSKIAQLILFVDNKEVDRVELNEINDKGLAIILSLNEEKFFVQADDHSYQFDIKNGELNRIQHKLVPRDLKGAEKSILFLSLNREVEFYLNDKGQYNVIVRDSSKILEKLETFNTSHIGAIDTFLKKPEATPDVIYSHFTKELFFHQPVDISYVAVDLWPPEIHYGLMYLEMNQNYTLRRYFDQRNSDRFVLKELPNSLELVKVSDFNGADFAGELRTNKERWSLMQAPHSIHNGRVLFELYKFKQGRHHYEYKFEIL